MATTEELSGPVEGVGPNAEQSSSILRDQSSTSEALLPSNETCQPGLTTGLPESDQSNSLRSSESDQQPGLSPVSELKRRNNAHDSDDHTPRVDKKVNKIERAARGYKFWLTRAERPSRLDLLSADSAISRSEFRGFLTLSYISCYIYLLANPIYHKYDTGSFFDLSMAKNMFSDFFLLMFTWGCIMGWSFTSYLLWKTYSQHRFPLIFYRIMQTITQIGLCLGCTLLVLSKDWAVFPSVFVCVIGALYSMKMHSYTETVLEFDTQGSPDHLPKGMHFPECCTFSNYVRYLVRPVLTYEIWWPQRKGNFRTTYFLLKVTHMLASLMALYLLLTTRVIPVVVVAYRRPLVYTVVKLIGSLILVDLLLFFFMFECVCNALAELTDHGDRDFYEDWWNSKNLDEFSRKWNKPVHEFLLRHVHYETYNRFKLNKVSAAALTFVFSAFCHELILAVTLRMLRFYMFGIMLCQIPLIAVLLRFKEHKIMTNVLFWSFILIGVPILETLYAKDWSAKMAATNSDRSVHFPPIF